MVRFCLRNESFYKVEEERPTLPRGAYRGNVWANPGRCKRWRATVTHKDAELRDEINPCSTRREPVTRDQYESTVLPRRAYT